MTSSSEFSHSGALRLLAGIADRYSLACYVRSGPHQLFERLYSSATHSFNHSWLYMPSPYARLLLEQASSKQHQQKSDTIWLDPTPADDIILYPIVRAGEIVAIIVTADNTPPRLNAADKHHAETALTVIQQCAEPDLRHTSSEFVRELFQSENSAPQFMKRLLGMVTTEWPRSCAGLYTEIEGVYHLRLATGDVSRWHRLPRQLEPETTMQFLESMYRQEYFIAADAIPDYPSLLNAPPDFMFLHEGVLSERSKQLVLMAGPGTLATLSVNRLIEYYRLLGEIRELQFAHGAELLASFSRIVNDGIESRNIDEELAETSAWLSQQINVTRTSLVIFGRDGSPVVKTMATNPPTGVTTGSDDSLCIPQALMSALRDGRTCHIEDIQTADFSEAQLRDRFINHVMSELYLPLKTPGGVIGAYVIGSSVIGSYLADCEELLQAVASYYSLWLQRTQRESTVRLTAPAAV